MTRTTEYRSVRHDLRTIFAAVVFALASTAGADGQTGVFTYHNDNARTGLNAAETTLTPANVNATGFGKVASYGVDGFVYAEPLYIPGVAITGQGTHDIVLVATEHDSVYAFDSSAAGSPAPLWATHFLTAGLSTMSSGDVSCGQIVPEIGITGTPVVDPATGTAYVVAATKTSATPPHYIQTLHALSLADGSEKFGGPVVIGETINNGNGSFTFVSGPGIAGTGNGAVGGVLTFNAFSHKARPGLLLGNNTVYTFWSSHCDIEPSHGWVIGFDQSTLQRKSVYNTTPNGGLATIWNSGAGPVMDSAGRIFLLPGNGTFEETLNGSGFPSGSDFGDAFQRIVTDSSTPANPNPNGYGLKIDDYFTPFNHIPLTNADEDVGSGGILLLPGSVGSGTHPSLLVGAGKEGRIYLIDRDHMGGFNASADSIVQEIPGAIGSSFGMSAYFNGAIYYGGVGDNLKQFSIGNATLSGAPVSKSVTNFAYPGTTPSVSANGTTNGIVWAIQTSGSNAVLHAYDATNLANQLYDSSLTNGRDSTGGYVKFAVPMIAAGRVFVGTTTNVTAFGLLSPPCAPDMSGVITVARGGFRQDLNTHHYFQRVTLTNTGATAISGPVSIELGSLTSGVSLANGTGVTSCGAAGVPYLNADLSGSNGSLAAGASVVLTFEFADPGNTQIRYSTAVVAGQGSR